MHAWAYIGPVLYLALPRPTWLPYYIHLQVIISMPCKLRIERARECLMICTEYIKLSLRRLPVKRFGSVSYSGRWLRIWRPGGLESKFRERHALLSKWRMLRRRGRSYLLWVGKPRGLLQREPGRLFLVSSLLSDHHHHHRWSTSTSCFTSSAAGPWLSRVTSKLELRQWPNPLDPSPLPPPQCRCIWPPSPPPELFCCLLYQCCVHNLRCLSTHINIESTYNNNKCMCTGAPPNRNPPHYSKSLSLTLHARNGCCAPLMPCNKRSPFAFQSQMCCANDCVDTWCTCCPDGCYPENHVCCDDGGSCPVESPTCCPAGCCGAGYVCCDSWG